MYFPKELYETFQKITDYYKIKWTDSGRSRDDCYYTEWYIGRDNENNEWVAEFTHWKCPPAYYNLIILRGNELVISHKIPISTFNC